MADKVASLLQQPLGPAILVRFLRQEDSRHPPEELSRVADSILAVIRRTEASELTAGVALHGVQALGGAGSREGPGVAFRGAAERLNEVAVGDGVGAILAVVYLGRLADEALAIRLLESIARLDRPPALTAVKALDEELGPAGIATVRRLFEEKQLRSATALEHARWIAGRRGWRPER